MLKNETSIFSKESHSGGQHHSFSPEIDTDFFIEKPRSLDDAVNIYKHFPQYLGSSSAIYNDSVPVAVTLLPITQVPKSLNLLKKAYKLLWLYG